MRPCLVLLLCAACAGSSGPTRSASRHDLDTPLAGVGSRCSGNACTCREVDDYNRGGLTDETAPAEGSKRFEVRTGRGLDEITVTVEGRGTLTKSVELPGAACGYLDLPPGKHHVHLRAHTAEAQGMVPALFVNEWSPRTHDWYSTFSFRCGGGETCTKDHMALWSDTDGKKPRGIFDPCGSARIEGLRWQVVHAPDVKVLDLELDFDLTVYKFVPRFPHGSKTCKGVGGVDVEDTPQPLPQ